MAMDIYRKGDVVASVELEEGSAVHRDLMGDHYARLKFTLGEPVLLETADYVVTDWGEFVLTEPYRPDYDTETGGYGYDAQFQAYYERFALKIFRYTPASDTSEVEFTLTATLETHLSVVVANINALAAKDDTYLYNGSEYTYSLDNMTSVMASEASSYKSISFSSVSIIDALTIICEEYDVEWWFEDNVIHVGKCDLQGDAVTFEIEGNVKEMSRDSSTATFANRVIAFGSTRNIPESYHADETSDVITSVADRRLRLPTATCPYGYVQTDDVEEEADAVEYVYIDEDIYPRTDCVVGTVTTYTSNVTDEDTGETVSQTFYRITDSSGLIFKDEYILDGETLHVVFESGSLNGMDFEVEFVEDDDYENGFYYEIVVNDDYGIDLPNETLHPEEGDTFTLYNWDADALGDTGLIEAAEEELYEAAMEKLEELSEDPYTYTCALYPDSVTQTYDLGQAVTLINKAFFAESRESRVIGYEIKLDIPEDEPEYIVGRAVQYSLTGSLQEQIDDINYNGSSYSSSSGGSSSSVYLITSNDSTRASDYNVYTAKRSDINYLSATKDDTAEGHITFEDGLTVTDATVEGDVASDDFSEEEQVGFAIKRTSSGGSDAWFTNLDIWGKATFQELEIRKLSAIGGTVVLTGASSTIVKVEEYYDDGEMVGWKCWYKADDGTTATTNTWEAGDQARCQSFNIDEGTYENVGNKDYWRCVILVSASNEKIYDDSGNALYDGQEFGWVVLSLTNAQSTDYGSTYGTPDWDGDDAYLSVPAAEDVIVCLGHQPQSEAEDGEAEGQERMHAIVLSATEDDGPAILMYKNIYTFSLDGTLVAKMSPAGWQIESSSFQWVSGDGQDVPNYTYMGEWTDDSVATQYTLWSYEGEMWRYDGEEATSSAPSTGVSGWTRLTYTIDVTVDATSSVLVRLTGVEQAIHVNVDVYEEGTLVHKGEDLDVDMYNADGDPVEEGEEVMDGVTFSGVTEDSDGGHSAVITLTVSDAAEETLNQVLYAYITYNGEDYRKSVTVSLVDLDTARTVILDLTNENSVIPCLSDGSVQDGYVFEVTEAHLYEGTEDIRDGDGVTWETSGEGCEYTFEDFVITPTAITADTATISVQATYSGQTYQTEYRLTKAYGNVTVYSLSLDMAAIHYDSDGDLKEDTLGITVRKISGGGSTDITDWETLVSEGLYIYVGGVTEDCRLDNIDSDNYASLSCSLSSLTSTTSVTVYLASTDGITTYDRETLYAVTDGADGEGSVLVQVTPDSLAVKGARSVTIYVDIYGSDTSSSSVYSGWALYDDSSEVLFDDGSQVYWGKGEVAITVSADDGDAVTAGNALTDILSYDTCEYAVDGHTAALTFTLSGETDDEGIDLDIYVVTGGMAYIRTARVVSVIDGSALIADLTNENSLVLCDDAGNEIESYETTTLTVFLGNTDVTADCDVTLTCDGIGAATYDPSTGVITITDGLTADTGTVTIHVEYDGYERTVTYTVKRIYGTVVYRLVSSLGNIAVDSSGALKSSTLTLSVVKVSSVSGTSVLTTYEGLEDEGLEIGYEVDGGGTWTEVTSSSLTLSLSELSISETLSLRLSGADGTAWDSETLYVTRDGEDGEGSVSCTTTPDTLVMKGDGTVTVYVDVYDCSEHILPEGSGGSDGEVAITVSADDGDAVEAGDALTDILSYDTCEYAVDGHTAALTFTLSGETDDDGIDLTVNITYDGVTYIRKACVKTVKDGETGVGIESITEYYARSKSKSSSPSSWSTTCPTLTSTYKYLWNYETITYTDGSTSSTTAHVIGVYGDTGETGVGISSVTNYYARSTSNTTAPTSWSTTCPTLTSTYKYLWNYETITYTDGSTSSTTAHVIGVYGDTGDASDVTGDSMYTFKNASVSGTSDSLLYSGTLSVNVSAYDTDLSVATIDSVVVNATGNCSASTTLNSSGSTITVVITPSSRSVTYSYEDTDGDTESETVKVSYTSGFVVLKITIDGEVYLHTVTWTLDVSEITSGLEWDNERLISQYSSLVADLDTLSGTVSTIEQTAEEISLSVDTINDGLAATGIDIESGTITLTADNFVVQNTSGQNTMYMGSNGEVYFTTYESSSSDTVSSQMVINGNSWAIKFGNAQIKAEIREDGTPVISGYNSDGDLEWILPEGLAILSVNITSAKAVYTSSASSSTTSTYYVEYTLLVYIDNQSTSSVKVGTSSSSGIMAKVVTLTGNTKTMSVTTQTISSGSSDTVTFSYEGSESVSSGSEASVTGGKASFYVYYNGEQIDSMSADSAT